MRWRDKMSNDVTKNKASEITKLADKYGFSAESVEKMIDIYPSLSLRDFFKDNEEVECVVQVLADKGKQSIPADSSKFELNEKDVVEQEDGTRVVMKPVLVVQLYNSPLAGNIYSRIPSGSESAGLLKIEYNRQRRGMSLEGAFLVITESTFTDKNGVEREGYSVTEVAKEYTDKFTV